MVGQLPTVRVRDDPGVVASSEVIDETTDASGNRVVLLRRVWEKVLIDHPEIEPFQAELLAAVSGPDHSSRDPVHQQRRRYYAREAGPSRWLMAVVSYEQDPARIVSAFGLRKDPRSWKP